jgi:3-methyladenine DNA glycosylase AlkD
VATTRARALVADRLDAAVALGRAAGDHVHEPASVVAELRSGLRALADPEYLAGPLLGVRQPLLTAVGRGLRAATRRDSTATLLDLAEALVRDDLLELHWLAYGLADRTIATDPERTWQLVRAEARRAGDWISVDNLAHVAGRGILAEPYRWAELEQLVYSPHRWERRLVGSTIATIPFVDRTAGRAPAVAARALAILEELVGDREPDVARAISWALRNLRFVDADAVAAFLRREAATAGAADDGNRAWVVRDTFEKLPPGLVAELRALLGDVRRRPGAPSTSRAAATAAAFAGLGLDMPPAERPLVPRT